jgi:hypothetical protein
MRLPAERGGAVRRGSAVCSAAARDNTGPMTRPVRIETPKITRNHMTPCLP